MERSRTMLQRAYKLTIVVVTLFVCAMCLAEEQRKSVNGVDDAAKIKSEILKIEEARNQAMLKHDTVTLDHLCADDVAWINQDGDLLAKSQVLSDLKTGKQSFSTVAHDEVQMHIYENTVVVFGVSTSTVQYHGTLRNKPRRFTNVYVRHNGEWKLVDHQVTPIEN